MLLKGKAALVTGAGRGIGREVARLLAAEGASVIVNDPGVAPDGSATDERPAEGVVEVIRADGGTASANFDSVADADGARRMVEQVVREFGRIDILVNAAGILRDRMFHKMSIDEWDAVVNVHLRGTFLTCQAAVPLMRAQQYGRIINFVSTAGLIGNIGQANYAAAKLGIVGLTRTIALENAQKNVTANCVSPWAWTRLTNTIPTDSSFDASRVAKLKVLHAADVAPLVGYLATEEAGNVTGQIFGVRGKEVMVFSQMRPVRSVHNSEGWTAATLGPLVQGALRNAFTGLDVSATVFNYDPLT